MMNSNIYAENHGKRNIIIFVVIDLKREIKEDTVFVMRIKSHIRNAFQKRIRFDQHINCTPLKKRKFGKSRRADFITKSSKSCKITR